MLYLYGFVSVGTPSPDDLTGVDGAPVSLIQLDGFAPAVSRVAEDPYGSEALDRRMKDLDWVARRGADHERVVTWFVDRSQILPVRVFTLYSGREALVSSARERRDRILAELERLAGLREWDLKISYDAGRLRDRLGEVSDEIGELDREIDEASPGRRYLLERKRDERARSSTSQEARRLAEELVGDVDDLAVETTRMPVPGEAGSMPVVLNAALLVPVDREDRVRKEVARRAEELESWGIDVSYSGPWAPYRFVRTADDEA